MLKISVTKPTEDTVDNKEVKAVDYFVVFDGRRNKNRQLAKGVKRLTPGKNLLTNLDRVIKNKMFLNNKISLTRGIFSSSSNVLL